MVPPSALRKFCQAQTLALALRTRQQALFLDRFDGAAHPLVPRGEGFSPTTLRALLLVGIMLCCFLRLVIVCLQLFVNGLGDSLRVGQHRLAAI